MFKKSIIAQSVLLAMAIPVIATAETTMKVELFNETAVYTKSGQTIGQANSMLDTGDKQSAGDLMKFENSAKIFLNGDIGEESSWHGEVKIIYDSEAVNDEDNGGVNYKGHESYSQNDFFRELYVDTKVSDWYLRLGKQQVVWGTADGIKLLDIINPTDFREVNQNSPEDARIPIWMINAERDVGQSSNIQFIVSEVQENRIPGLNRGGDQGQPFIMKGVDTISGQVNGFLNIAPNLADVAASFQGAALNGGFTGGAGTNPTLGLTLFSGLTVDGFAKGSWDITTPGQIIPMNTPPDTTFVDPTNTPGYAILNNFAQNGFTGQPGFVGLDPNGNAIDGSSYVGPQTNLTPVTGTGFTDTSWSPEAATSAFEYMSNATFATFNTFSAFGATPTGIDGGVTTQYVTEDYDSEANAGFRFKSNLSNGLNYSLNYFYHYSANPAIDLSWRDPNTGEKLTTQLAPTDWTDNTGAFYPGQDIGNPDAGDFYTPNANVSLTRDQARANHGLNPTNVLLHNSAGQYYGALDPSVATAAVADLDPTNDPIALGMGPANLRFTERLQRVHSIGGAFDMAVDTDFAPVVIRGEFLYDKDELQPVIDKYLLSIGDLSNALTMQEADYFKYVIGVDVTVMTNLLISGQFIQFRNLDFVNSGDSCTTQGGSSVDCSVYTADFSTMSLSNGFQKAEENKEFYSLFLSKPIGEEQLGRWNNIFIYEENGGYWNRLDADYSVTDNFIVNAAWNNYWGDENTTFGQLKDSSSVQVGFKYIFDQY